MNTTHSFWLLSKYKWQPWKCISLIGKYSFCTLGSAVSWEAPAEAPSGSTAGSCSCSFRAKGQRPNTQFFLACHFCPAWIHLIGNVCIAAPLFWSLRHWLRGELQSEALPTQSTFLLPLLLHVSALNCGP